MRDHQRILGTLFIAWGAVQIITAVLLAIPREGVMPPPALFWVFSILAALAFGWAGWRLRLHDPRMRLTGILLSVLALLSFPLGTALGIYGLWVFFRRRPASAES